MKDEDLGPVPREGPARDTSTTES